MRRWKDTPPGANPIGGQRTIDDDLEIADADIFICLYWKKLGTIIEGLDETGTEHELNIAIDSFKRHEKSDIKFFLKTAAPTEQLFFIPYLLLYSVLFAPVTHAV